MRSGAQTLTLLASPINVAVLQALSEGPKQQTELRRVAGSPAQSTLRAQLKKLDAAGAIVKHRRDRFPGALEYELSDAGRDLLFVASSLQDWLAASPEGPLELGESPSKAAIKALAEAWSTCMLRALAAKPLTLTELDGAIASINYPLLERRLAAMRLAGQIEAREGNGRGTPYGVSEWGRQAVAPLIAAARWERRHRPEETAPIARVDVEAAFLLAMPLLRLPEGTSGSCRMAADIPNGKKHDLAGVLAEARDGRIASSTTRLEGHPDAWASGSPPAWLAATIEADHAGLELGGNCALARTLLDGLHRALFGRLAARARVIPPSSPISPQAGRLRHPHPGRRA
jgi:DNA-binding HxlR family transcriptional regulator